jgi:two-component system nitrogen regulation response regulator NtrX
MPLVLVVDDVRNLADQYAYDLKRIAGYATRVATSGKEALDILTMEPVDCVILDLEMPGVDGFEVLRRIKKDGFHVPVIVYTGTGNYDRCVQAIKLGAYSFIDKAESMERVVHEVRNAIERWRLEAEVQILRKDAGAERTLIGGSEAMRALEAQIARVAPIPSAVLIVGESGTGKELVAHELHSRSPRAQGPLVAINSAALPDALIESELFGHERGAFTGANRTHHGAFERASGGTLFLDEIGELPSAVQAKLLRVLEQGEVTRIGAERGTKVDVRVIAATHRDLDADVASGRFRQDLYYRLNVHVVRVPPLRDRASDIPELANHFLSTTCARFGVRRKRFDRAVLDALMSYDWRRNNVRELRNIVERMVIATDGDTIGAVAIPTEIQVETPIKRSKARTFREKKSEAERQIVVSALEKNEWSISRTATDLGLADHASLLKVMRRLGIKSR